MDFRFESIDTLDPVDGGVEVAGETFAEAIVTTGHAHDWPGSLAHEDLGDLRVIASVYPATNLDEVGDDDVALVRGAALTFIDVVRYVRAKVFYPVTRSGRFMEVKAYLDDDQAREAKPAIEAASRAILDCESLPALKSILVDCTAQVLRVVDGEGTPDDIRAVLDGEDFTGDPVAELRASVAAASGETPWTTAIAAGVVFRETYDALIERCLLYTSDAADE